MRIHFQSKPWDLFVVVAYGLGMSGVLLGLHVGNLAAIFLVFILPGYVLMACLFPRDKEIQWIERIGLSFVLSVAAVPLLGLMLNSTPYGITFASVVVTTGLFTALVGGAAFARRMRIPSSDRLELTLNLRTSWWLEFPAVDKALAILVAASITGAVGTLAYVASVPRPGEQYTEFYVLGPGGNAAGYPRCLNASQPSMVLLGIANHETKRVNYTVRIDLVGIRVFLNATTGANETAELNRTTWSWLNVTIGNGQNWTELYPFQINTGSLWKVQFLLFKDGDLLSVYRELYLFVQVPCA